MKYIFCGLVFTHPSFEEKNAVAHVEWSAYFTDGRIVLVSIASLGVFGKLHKWNEKVKIDLIQI